MQHGSGNFQRNNPARAAAIVTRWACEPMALPGGQRWCAKSAGFAHAEKLALGVYAFVAQVEGWAGKA